MEQVTYGALKKPSARKEMLGNDMVSLGTQSGNYGLFTEEARVLTRVGAAKIKIQLDMLFESEGIKRTISESLPILSKLIK